MSDMKLEEAIRVVDKAVDEAQDRLKEALGVQYSVELMVGWNMIKSGLLAVDNLKKWEKAQGEKEWP